jgi:50S ribosomal protein L16 3-hydroxylase
MLFPLAEITRDEFLSRYWRQRPLHIPKAAKQLTWLPAAVAFRSTLKLLERVRPDQVRSSASSTFGQNVDVASADIRELSSALSAELDCPSVWFDVVETRSCHAGIGCHFDNSDNFTIQVQGKKQWRLHEPSVIPQEVRRHSLLRDQDLAHADVEMPGEALEFDVQEGDLLYIPLLWLHEGQSEGESLSCVITCNSETPLALLPYLHWLLAERSEWSEAIPFDVLARATRNGDDATLDRYFDRLFEALRDPELVSSVKARWLADRFRRVYGFPTGKPSVRSTGAPLVS